MFEKETKDKKYQEDPFRAVNFKIDDYSDLRCPNGKSLYFPIRAIKGNQYGRQEEIYVCEDCGGCPYAEKCKKTDKERAVRLNEELTAMHKEVVETWKASRGRFCG